jgi:hypothetical protein
MNLDARNPRRLPAHRRRELEIARGDLEAAIFGASRYCAVQSALAIPNEAGASFRADNNTALQANATFQAGASAPGTTYADEYWWDTTNQVLKKRNQANSAWIVIATRDEAFVLARSANTILGLSDVGKTIIATGTFTQTITAAATLGDGWYCFYRNDGTGVITIDPNASETIDGATLLVLFPGEGCRISCNGSALTTQGLSTCKKINVNTTAVASVGAGPDTLMSYTLPANSLSINGKGVRVTAWGTTANNANAKTITINFGSVSFGTTMTPSIVGAWRFVMTAIRVGSNAQDWGFVLTEVVNATGLAANKEKQVAQSNGTQTDTADIIIKITSTGTAASDIVQEGMLVEFFA